MAAINREDGPRISSFSNEYDGNSSEFDETDDEECVFRYLSFATFLCESKYLQICFLLLRFVAIISTVCLLVFFLELLNLFSARKKMSHRGIRSNVFRLNRKADLCRITSVWRPLFGS